MNTVEKTQKLDIGPGALGKSPDGGAGFVMSAAEWLAIQTYAIDGAALPNTMDKFKTSLGSGAPSDLSDFNQLITAYDFIVKHVGVWTNLTFPSSVSLASDIHNYAIQAPTYYNAILPLAQKLTDNPDDQHAKDQLAAVLGVLSKSATTFHNNAAAVADKIKDFANETQNDKITLSGTDGKHGLQKYYNDKYGQTSTDVINITNQLKSEKDILDAANAEYNHDVVVAATTPTYVWVWPFGTIAAAIVAGIYGDKAVKALERVRAAQQQINNLSAQLAADALLMTTINTSESGITNILGSLNAALPIIQKIQGVWGAISDDLNSIIELIKTNIEEALPIIMDLGVESAITAWTAVGAEADAYRLHAYVTVNP